MSNIRENELVRVTSWDEAVKHSKSYVDNELVLFLTEQFRIHLENRNHKSVGEFWSVRKSHLILGWNQSCGSKKNPIVADIGGGNGYMLDWVREAHPDSSPVWTVFESPEIANAYQSIPNDLGLRFIPSSKLNSSMKFDLTIMSCTLQYLENWEDVLKLAFQISSFVLLMRVPLIDSANDEFYIQKPSEGLYQEANASWPIRLFSRSNLLSMFESHSSVVFAGRDPEETFPHRGNVYPLETYLLRGNLRT